jgi:hypothetical protein
MIFVIEGSRTKIDQPDFRVEQNFPVARASHVLGRRRWYSPVVCESLILVVHKEYILRFEVGMYKTQIMQDWAGLELAN